MIDDTPPPEREVPKIPSYMHLPWSREHARDQKFMTDRQFEAARIADEPVVVTEKLDGANVRLTREAVHSRSRRSPTHDGPGEVYSRLKSRHARFKDAIPEGVVLYGEWMYAEHSVHYPSLEDFLFVFGALDTESMKWQSWAETESLADAIGAAVPPVIDQSSSGFEGRMEPSGESQYGPTREGYVVRLQSGFSWRDFRRSVAKCVRENHVQTDKHWAKQAVTPNELADK